jgi:hypothetical protein
LKVSSAQLFPQVPESGEPLAYGPKCCVEVPELVVATSVRVAEANAWSGVGIVEVNVLSSAVKSTIENVSSPTLLTRDVMRLVRDVVGRVVVVGAGFAVPATVDTPLIPVTSKTVMARTESFLRSIIVFSLGDIRVEIYGMFKPAIFSRLDIIEIGKFRDSII